jgi:hypothetical protein
MKAVLGGGGLREMQVLRLRGVMKLRRSAQDDGSFEG